MINVIEVLVFLNQSLYCYAAVPQVITNYRLRSAAALSDVYLIALFNTYALLMYYMFCLPQPLAYRISILFQFSTTIVLLLQRCYYHFNETKISLMPFWLVNAVALARLYPYAVQDPLWMGGFAGWLALGFILCNRLPQIINVYRIKSVAGFNPMFLLLFGCAGILEMFIVLGFGLPMQTFFMALSGFCFILIMAYQWYVYK